MIRILRLAIGVALLAACARSEQPVAEAPKVRPSILLVTLDTTRADSIGPEAKDVSTPAFNALAARGRRFRQAYATVPQTLPSHASMMTGLYPAGHGVHENARHLAATHPLVAEKLREAGYRTGAFVSAFVLAKRFGLARGFETYDDVMPAGKSERSARETTDRAIAYLRESAPQPTFLWVHYFDPHHPYVPSYRGEIESMDAQLGRLVAEFQKLAGEKAIVVASDHGEGLGEHGESQHGNLVYQSTMHVPLLIAGPGVAAGVSENAVSTRRVFHTILDFAGIDAKHSLRGGDAEVVLGESMIPFLQFGWQPQVMAVEGRQKVILAGAVEAYDVIADPNERRDLGATANLSRAMRQAVRDYPIPSLEAAAAPANMSEEERKQLAALGYIASEARPVIRKDAPRPRDMAHLFDELEDASALFVAEQYRAVIPLLEKILAEDPHNLVTALRLATAHSSLGDEAAAEAAFRRAEAIAPQSPDVRAYLAMHYARTANWQRAVPLLERVVAESPERLPALEALAAVRERQQRPQEALALRQKINAMKTPTVAELIRTGELAMSVGNTEAAIEGFERARQVQGQRFAHDLELGVLYLAQRRFEEARAALDRVPRSHPAYAMALFKRAQVSVLLNEPDRAARIEAARRNATPETRELIARERLFAR